MSLRNINTNPRFLQYLISQQIFGREPLTVVDIGARGGFEEHWSNYGNQVHLIGFEADAEECERLNRQETTSTKRIFPVALHRDKAKRPFYVTASPSASGFYPADMRHVHRFPEEVHLHTTKTIEIDTLDFDTYATENHIDKVDFIKLDTQGTELDILKGAIRTLKETVIGLSVEVEFLQWYTSQPVFSDVDSFLRSLGFQLYDLATYRYTKKSLPAVPTWAISRPTAWGQIIWGQALYLRDGVDEIEHLPILGCGWGDTKILKLASLMELFCLPDCAIELLQSAYRKGYLHAKAPDYFIDLLMPLNLSRGNEGDYKKYLHSLLSDQYKKRKRLRFLPRPIRRIVGYGLKRVRNAINNLLETDSVARGRSGF